MRQATARIRCDSLRDVEPSDHVLWQKVKIREIGKVVTGMTPPTKHQAYYGDDYLFVTPSDLDFDSYLVSKTERCISKQGYEKYSNRFIPAMSTMYTCIGSTIGKIGLCRETVLTNQQINSIIPNDVHDAKFVYYLMRSQTNEIRALNAGCAVPIINKGDFENIDVHLPPLPVQRRIADVLSAYDDLIENNRRRIAILEETARLTYRKWFGGEYRSNEWEVHKVSEVLESFPRPKRVPKESYITEGAYPCIDQGKDFIGGYTNDEEAIVRRLPAIVFGDHTRVLKYVSEPFACGADGTQLLYAKDGVLTQSYLYCALKEIDLTNYFYARHFKILKSKEVFVPPYSMVKQFTDEVSCNLELISVLRKHGVKLAAARDMLLPRLMKGEVV